MSEQTLYESERTRTREAIGAYLRRIGDAFDSGRPVPVDEDGAVTADPPAESVFEIEYEREDEELSLEFEIEWSADDDAAEDATAIGEGDGETSASEDDTAGASEDAVANAMEEAAADTTGDAGAGAGGEDAQPPGIESEETIPAGDSNATFELYRDRADEWRWRLRHQNGNIIADSGEGYGKKATAVNGIESVRANAPGAAVEEQE